MLAVRRILVPVDYSDGSRAALEYAMGLAEMCGAGIDVLHVMEIPPQVGRDVQVRLESGEVRRLSEMMEAQARDEADAFLKRFRDRGTVQVGMRLEEGTPHKRIVEVAAKDGYDLIVMNTHGLSGFQRFVIGSVAEKVMRNAPCPILIVRHPDEETTG